MQVGDPKLRLADSEKDWPDSFVSFVQRTTSHGGEDDSVLPPITDEALDWSWYWLVSELLRLCVRLKLRSPGEDGRPVGESRPLLLLPLGEAMRDWKRWSKGRNDGLEPRNPKRDRLPDEGNTLLPPKDETMELRFEADESGTEINESPPGLPGRRGRPSAEPSSEALSCWFSSSSSRYRCRGAVPFPERTGVDGGSGLVGKRSSVGVVAVSSPSTEASVLMETSATSSSAPASASAPRIVLASSSSSPPLLSVSFPAVDDPGSGGSGTSSSAAPPPEPEPVPLMTTSSLPPLSSLSVRLELIGMWACNA